MNIIKRYTYFELVGSSSTIQKDLPIPTKSENWIQWYAILSPSICTYCLLQYGRIFPVNDPTLILPQVHDNCRCYVERLSTYLAGTITDAGENGTDIYLLLHHCLPNNYLTKEEARAQGWKSWLGNLNQVLPGMMIGGNIYKNRDKRLPTEPGRIWYEADLDYNGGYREGQRILFSSDGLVFITFNHYLTFSEVILGGI